MDAYKRELRRSIVDEVQAPKYASKKRDDSDSPQKNEAHLAAGLGNPNANQVLNTTYLGKQTVETTMQLASDSQQVGLVGKFREEF